ncbi:Uncharacterized protein Fot_49128 [Forsythia ovata]|uniref:Uncharacterized protein n=1 Tax=Forsythia ovata TaxID=205694 RepID=A0ABD1QC82_9LAMI
MKNVMLIFNKCFLVSSAARDHLEDATVKNCTDIHSENVQPSNHHLSGKANDLALYWGVHVSLSSRSLFHPYPPLNLTINVYHQYRSVHWLFRMGRQFKSVSMKPKTQGNIIAILFFKNNPILEFSVRIHDTLISIGNFEESLNRL